MVATQKAGIVQAPSKRSVRRAPRRSGVRASVRRRAGKPVDRRPTGSGGISGDTQWSSAFEKGGAARRQGSDHRNDDLVQDEPRNDHRKPAVGAELVSFHEVAPRPIRCRPSLAEASSRGRTESVPEPDVPQLLPVDPWPYWSTPGRILGGSTRSARARIARCTGVIMVTASPLMPS